MGRPTISGEARDKVLKLRITANERQALKAEAKKRGLSVAELLMLPWRSE